jgi:hypothetical protein
VITFVETARRVTPLVADVDARVTTLVEIGFNPLCLAGQGSPGDFEPRVDSYNISCVSGLGRASVRGRRPRPHRERGRFRPDYRPPRGRAACGKKSGWVIGRYRLGCNATCQCGFLTPARLWSADDPTAARPYKGPGTLRLREECDAESRGDGAALHAQDGYFKPNRPERQRRAHCRCVARDWSSRPTGRPSDGQT